jgi:hypothetical protein
MKKPFLALVFVASALVLASCNQQPDNSAQVKALEDRIRQLEDQEKQLQLQTEQDKLAADRAALEADRQKLREQQNALVQATPTSKPYTASADSSSEGSARPADYQDDSGPKVSQRPDTDSYNLFYDRLQPEGRWFEDDTYGYVWQPGIAERDDNWRPYTDGHWAYTDRGWTWVSNEDFGWATYHYGRWTRVRGVGWIWVPGNTWAPAWVSWRQTDRDDYVGWAPLPPECDPTPGVKVEAWVDNYYGIGPAAYVFLKTADLVRPTYREAILPPQQSLTVITQTRNVTNITYNNKIVNSFGPQYQQLAQATNNRLERYQINYQQQTQPNANFKTVVAGNQLQVVAPAPQLQPRATIQPQSARQIQHAQVERGWQNLDPAKAQQIKEAFQKSAPPIPKALPPQPAPPPKPVIAVLARKTGQSAAAVPQPQRAATLPNDNQIAVERAKIEAEKAQLELQRQALLTGQKPANPPAQQNQKPNLPGQPNQPQQAEQQQKEQALKSQQQAEAEKAKQLEAQKAQQAEQARLQQETQLKLQAEQQQREQALRQQQQAEAEKARQLEAQKAQQAEQARLQQETQLKLQAEQQQREQAVRQQQQAEAEKARQLEAQKAQQAEQARLQQETQLKLQAEQQQRERAVRQQQQAEAEKARQLEAQRAQQAEQARLQQETQQKLQAEQQQREQALRQQQQRAEAEKAKPPEKKPPEEKKKKEEKTPSPGQQ